MIRLTGNKTGNAAGSQSPSRNLSYDEQIDLRNRFDEIISEIFFVMDKGED